MSKGKKWTIALAVLVLIAVVAVILIVCLPKNINDIKDRAFKEQEISFLQSDEELNLFNSFQSKIAKSASQFNKNAEDAKTVSYMLVNVLDFYNDYLVFARDSKTFQSQYRVVLDSFNNANSYQKSMTAILKEVEDYVGPDGTTYITGAWPKFEKEYKKYLESYVKALEGLGKIIVDSLPKGIKNNAFSNLVINTTTDYLNAVSTAKENYSFIVKYANRFITKYVVNTTEIENYEFSENLKLATTKINKFKTIYNDRISSVIRSIDETGIVYKNIEADDSGILVSLKSFLNGGISA